MMGGYTRVVPDEDRLFKTKAQFEDELAVYMAGHVAEDMVFEEQSTGAANDIERATGLARRMVTEFGMSRTLGPRAFGKKDELIFLGREISEQRNYSDEVAYQIDQEIRELIDAAHERARAIVEIARRQAAGDRRAAAARRRRSRATSWRRSSRRRGRALTWWVRRPGGRARPSRRRHRRSDQRRGASGICRRTRGSCGRSRRVSGRLAWYLVTGLSPSTPHPALSPCVGRGFWFRQMSLVCVRSLVWESERAGGKPSLQPQTQAGNRPSSREGLVSGAGLRAEDEGSLELQNEWARTRHGAQPGPGEGRVRPEPRGTGGAPRRPTPWAGRSVWRAGSGAASQRRPPATVAGEVAAGGRAGSRGVASTG